jgi:membrane protein
MAQLQALVPSAGPIAAIGGKVLAYAVLVALAAAAAATLYRYGPSRAEAKWTWLTPGSLFFAFGWAILTSAFGFYVSRFGKYNVTYGSLAGVIVFVTWLYLSSFILLFGAEFNSEIEHQTARDTTADPGEKALGDRGAWSADHVADGPADEGKEAGWGSVEKPLSDKAADRQPGPSQPLPRQHEHPFLVSRATNRAASVVGLRKVGMVSAALSTIGFSLLRKRGREGAGAALVAGAVGLSLLKRKD